MSILDSIKGERKLTLNNWRFRILHWAFNVENPKPNVDTGLPSFLYTHYCPLFHLTNLIALLSPFILFFKFIVILFMGLAAIVELIPICEILDKIRDLMPERKEVPIKGKGPSLECERKCFIQNLCDCTSDFEKFWSQFDFKFLTKDDAAALYAEYMPRIEEARKEAKRRKERWRQNIIFWTNFSRVFIKWAMNIAYVALGLGLLFLAYEFMGVAWAVACWIGSSIVWLFTDVGSLSAIIFMGKVLLLSLFILIIITLILRFNIAQTFCGTVWRGLVYISPPFYVALVPFKWIKSGWDSSMEFVSMFYEENCPPIKIVSAEEGLLESIKDGEV